MIQAKQVEKPLIEATGLNVGTATGRPIVRVLNLSLGRDVVAVVGRNGVGKSTLFDVLSGGANPDSGDAQFLRYCGIRMLLRARWT